MSAGRASRAGLALFSVLAACRAPGEERSRSSLELPERFSADASPAEAGASDEPWWRSFGDAELSSLVEEALAHNLDLRASVARVAAARAQARIAGADRLPTLGLGADASRSQQVFVGLPVSELGGGLPGASVDDPLTSLSTSYGVSLDLSWELDLWGRLSAQARAAGAELVASAQDHRALRHSIAAQTAKAALAWREARLQVELAERSLASYASTRELVQRRFDGGLASAFELRLAQTDLASAQALVEERHGALERVVRQLELLVGRYPGGSAEAGPDELPPPPPAPPPGAPGALVARRPDLAAAEARLAAADERLWAARAALYPRLTLSGSAGRTGDDPDDLFDSDFSVWSIAAGLAQPLFQGGRLRAGVDLADAEVRGALASFESALLSALGEVEVALALEGRLARIEEAQRAASEEAARAVELARDRYEAGLSDLLEVLEVQRRSLSNESALLEVRRRRLDQRVDLHLALGGGFDDPEIPAKEDS